MKRACALLIGTIFFLACASPIVQHEQKKYPRCKVLEKNKSANIILVEIACPGKEPFVKKFHRK